MKWCHASSAVASHSFCDVKHTKICAGVAEWQTR